MSQSQIARISSVRYSPTQRPDWACTQLQPGSTKPAYRRSSEKTAGTDRTSQRPWLTGPCSESSSPILKLTEIVSRTESRSSITSQRSFPSSVFPSGARKSQRKPRRRWLGSERSGYTNLFTGLARCAYCNATIAFENKGSGSRGGSYLICGDAQRGRGCEATRWRYQDFETSFLAFVKELDLESIINSDEDAERRKRLEGERAAISGELSSVKQLMEKTYELLSAGGSTEFVAGKLKELTDRQADSWQSGKPPKEAEQLEFNARDSRFYSSREDIKTLVAKLQNPASMRSTRCVSR